MVPPSFDLLQGYYFNLLAHHGECVLHLVVTLQLRLEANQYAPLKITCRIELILILSKTISFRHRQMAQQKAATPTQIKFLISFD